MTNTEIEKVVLYANICLKRWDDAKAKDEDNIRSMILSWLNKVYVRSLIPYRDHRSRKAISKRINNSLFYTISRENGIHINSITIKHPIDDNPMTFPILDYEQLNKQANDLRLSIPVFDKAENIKFTEIENIKFT